MKIFFFLMRLQSYRVGDFVLVRAAAAPFQRQVPGQPQLVFLHGLADELQEFRLGARPIGAAVFQQLAAELQQGFRCLRVTGHESN